MISMYIQSAFVKQVERAPDAIACPSTAWI